VAKSHTPRFIFGLAVLPGSAKPEIRAWQDRNLLMIHTKEE
jgi:hypothetical protein